MIGAGVPDVVVDTSVHISSEVFASAASPSREVLARGFAGHFVFALSALLLDEIARKMIENNVPADDVADYLANVRVAGVVHPDVLVPGLICTDAEDLFVMALARSSGATCIVAHDRSLIDPDATPPGLPPPPFLARLRLLRGEPDDLRFP